MLAEEKNKSKQSNQVNEHQFPIVAIGAAAGGVEAMTELLPTLPQGIGMVYIYLQHPEAAFYEETQEKFRELTELKIITAKPGIELEPDQLYIIPQDQHLVVVDGKLEEATEKFNTPDSLPISLFFSALADEYKENAIGVLLSGTASDGILGLKAIKAAGGITFAQDDTAKFQTMPKSAIAEGVVDLVVAPSALAEELIKMSSQKDVYFAAINEINEDLLSDKDENLLEILQILIRATGVDFKQYKMNTIKRRIIRRVMVHKLVTLKEYLRYLKQNPREVNLLYQDLLIHVTTFFRDEETTTYLRQELLPNIIKQKKGNDAIRVWVPACSTGQEAYSLAMMVIETLGENHTNIPVQIFATDLSEMAINKARLGMYSNDDVVGVSPQRLQRFFVKLEGGYRIIKSIRDFCVFATHNIAKDPPFSRLDIISCCNLLIYMDVPLQKKLMATFHYSLNNEGYLVIGKSETPGASSYLFAPIDKKIKIYAKKKDAAAKASFEVNYRNNETDRLSANKSSSTTPPKPRNDEAELEKAVDKLLLKKFIPASVLVNDELDILQFRGSTGLYLEPSPGKASLNLMKMAKAGLGFELRSIVYKAKTTGNTAKKERIEINADEKSQLISIQAIPLKTDGEEYFLVVFEEKVVPKNEESPGTVNEKREKQLEAELVALREDMSSIVESQEAANEELQSANEEIVSSNEELQSINEELETSKEEIESSNEELITINQELQMRNEQLAEAQEYSDAVFLTIREALLILSKDLKVKSANAAFYNIFKLRKEEVIGQVIYDLSGRQWNMPPLKKLLEEMLPTTGIYTGFEMSHTFLGVGEKSMLLNARRVIQKEKGDYIILLAIEDISEFKQAQQIIADREAWFRNMADNAPVMIWVTGANRLCSFVNKNFLDFRGIALEDAIGHPWLLDSHPDDIERCQKIYDDSFKEKRSFEFTYMLKHNDGRYRKIKTKAKPNFTLEGHFNGYIGSCVEVEDQGGN